MVEKYSQLKRADLFNCPPALSACLFCKPSATNLVLPKWEFWKLRCLEQSNFSVWMGTGVSNITNKLTMWLFFWKVAPLGWKRTYTGCTQTTTVPAELEIPWGVFHLSIIWAWCYLTSVFEWELVYPTSQTSWLCGCFCKVAPLGLKKAYTGCTQNHCSASRTWNSLGGLSSKNYPRPILLNFNVWMGTGVSNITTKLTMWLFFVRQHH